MTMATPTKYEKKPEWIKVRPAASEGYFYLKERTKELGLSTVCQEARCPNIGECWSQKTLTIMIMGDTCTRFCKFCNVKTGKGTGWLDENEPLNTALLLKPLDLHYVVITSVDRDDLADNGAAHFAKTITLTKSECTGTTLEVLIGDLQGSFTNLKTIVDASPDVISHNLETVRRLTPKVRDRRATYDQSLMQLARVKEISPKIFTKSALMLGLGEDYQEVIECMRDMRKCGIDFLSIGQYLRPSDKHLPVVRYAEPKEFEELKLVGEDMGFLMVASGPLVRSSYKAGEFFIKEYIAKHRKDGYEV